METTKSEITIGHLVKRLGINLPSLKQWLDRGFIVARQKAKGRGQANIFAIGDIYSLELFRRLQEAGFPQQVASTIASEIGHHIEADVFEDGINHFVLIRWSPKQWNSKRELLMSKLSACFQVSQLIPGLIYSFQKTMVIEDLGQSITTIINVLHIKDKVDLAFPESEYELQRAYYLGPDED